MRCNLKATLANEENKQLHEMTIAMNIVDIATQQAEAEGAKNVEEIELEIGALAGIVIEALTFCFETACGDTIADGAVLKIADIPGRGRCIDCEFEFDVESFFTECPACSGYGVDIIEGKQLRIRSISIN